MSLVIFNLTHHKARLGSTKLKISALKIPIKNNESPNRTI
jgi:hypothetical protein